MSLLPLSLLTMSNALSLAALQTKADALSAEINAADPNLTVIYTIHNNGQLRSSLQMIEDSIFDHPAGQIAAMILRRNFPTIEPSGFQGIAAKNITHWLGFSNNVAKLAIISINIDQYDNYFDALADLYRQTWHAIEVAELCEDRAVLEKLGTRPLIPKRGPIGEVRANLRSDIFTCLMLRTEGYQDAIDQIGKRRALQAISRESRDKPEKFPFVLTVGATLYAAEQILDKLDQERPRLEKCRDMTEEIAAATTDDQVRQWWRFCEPAQDMAWRGYRHELILAAALYYSDDPYVRSITHQIEDLSGIPAAEADQLDRTFNPFIDIHRNEQFHYALIDETFDTVLAQVVIEDKSDLLLETAAKQNQELLQGRFLGWCAAALQSAAQAFDHAALQGRPPGQAAQIEFQMLRSGPPIDGLYKLTKEVINRRKAGEIIMLDQLPALAETIPELGILSKSLIQTRDHLKSIEMDTAIHADDLDMVLMPTSPTLSREFGHKMQPQIPAEVAFTPPTPSAPVLDFIPGQGPALPPQIRQPVDRGATPPPPAPVLPKTISADTHTGLSLEFDEAKEEQG